MISSRYIILTGLISSLVLVSGEYEYNDTISRILTAIRKHADYRVRPHGGQAQNDSIGVTLHINSFRGFDETKGAFHVDMYMRQHWHDPRLAFTGYVSSLVQTVVLKPQTARTVVWMPDIFIVNAVDEDIHQAASNDYGIRIKSDGSVLKSSKLHLTLTCNMEFQKFPMDLQECPIRIESYFNTAHDVSLRWQRGAKSVSVGKSAKFPLFHYLGHNTSKGAEMMATGTYESLKVTFRLRRVCAHYVAMTFLPACVLVVLSCLLFWMPLTALFERTFFTSFLLLASTIVMAASQYSTPQVGYLKALDVYVVSCFMFLVVAMLEVILLFLVARSVDKHQVDQFELMKDDENAKPVDQKAGNLMMFLHPKLVRRIDFALSIIYPAAFVLFNAIYWATMF